MSEEKKHLEVTVDTEELPKRLLVNGVLYKQASIAPDDRSQRLQEVAEFFYDKWPDGSAKLLLSMWLQLVCR